MKSQWGWMPVLSVVGGIGLLIVSLAYNRGRHGANWGNVLHWIGMSVIFLPIAFRIFSAAPRRQERLALLLLLALLLYLTKLLYSPLEFKFSDELQHWRGTSNVLNSGHLFIANTTLPASTYFPGLQILTVALIRLSGLSIFDAGIIVMAVSRLVLVGALYFFYERVSASPHLASIAALLYTTNPHYLSLSAFFTYQIAIVFMILALALIAMADKAGKYALPYKVCAAFSILALIFTHHVTTFVFNGLLVFYLAVTLFARLHKPDQTIPWKLLLFTAIASGLWLSQDSDILVDYFKPYVDLVTGSVSNLVAEAPPNSTPQVFRPPDSPPFERMITYGSVMLVLLILPIGLWFSWKRYKRNALALMLGIGALGYVVTIGIRLVAAEGAELAGRTWPFVFLVSSFAIAVAIFYMWKILKGDLKIEDFSIPLINANVPGAAFLNTLYQKLRAMAQTVYHRLFAGLMQNRLSRRLLKYPWILSIVGPGIALILFYGSITGGWPPYWGRLPGPYLVSASERSIEPEGNAAARWAMPHLGPGNRMVADLTNYLLMGAYGHQYSIYGMSELYTMSEITDVEIQQMCWYEVHYLLVDLRMSKALPVRGYYFNYREPDAFNYSEPIPLANLQKFDSLSNVDRIFDSGDIVIYDVHELCEEP